MAMATGMHPEPHSPPAGATAIQRARRRALRLPDRHLLFCRHPSEFAPLGPDRRPTRACWCARAPYAPGTKAPSTTFVLSRPAGSCRALLGAAAGKIGLTYDVLPTQQLNFFTKLLPGREFADIATINRELRSVKSPWELEKMAAELRKSSAPPSPRFRNFFDRGCGRSIWLRNSSTGPENLATKATYGCGPSTRSSSKGWPSSGKAPPSRAFSTAR